MTEWLDRHVPGVVGTRVAEWLDQTMCGWYGLNLDRLSALNWIDFFVIPYPGGDERWHVRGGNDQIVHRAAAALPVADRARRRRCAACAARDARYELTSTATGRVVADLVILTLPFTTLREVDLSRRGLSAAEARGDRRSWRWATTRRC